MKTVVWKVGALALLLALAGASPAAAQDAGAQAAVTVSATGSFARGGDFSGTITINRFEQRGNEIVAIGFVSGSLRRGGHQVGTALAGEVTWPVVVGVGGVSAASDRGAAIAKPARIAWSTSVRRSRIVPVQAGSCPVVQIALGAVNVNLLGAQVALDPVGLNLEGVTGTPLGDLVCAVSDLLGNVAGLVNLLNGILGLLTGLLGGLTGGLIP
jgi:hypothetical protein